MRAIGIATGIALLAVSGTADAQVTVISRSSRISGIDYVASNNGVFGSRLAMNRPGFVVRETGLSYLFGSGLWFGVRKKSGTRDLTPVFYTYNPITATGVATAGEHPALGNGASPNLYYSLDYDQNTGQCKGGAYGMPNWPLWLSSESIVPRPMRAGTFVGDNSKRNAQSFPAGPAFMPGVEEQLMARYHDSGLEAYEGSNVQQRGYPIGIQVQQNIYSWQIGFYRKSVILQYSIINVSGDTLRDCVIGQVADPDIGDIDSNDRITFYADAPSLRSGYAWNDTRDEGPYGAFILTLIEGPMTDARGFVDNTKRQAFRTQGEVGAFSAWLLDDGPMVDFERYDAMTAPHADWAIDREPGDQQAVLSTTRFTMAPGDTAHFAVALTVIDEPPGSRRDLGNLEASIDSDQGVVRSGRYGGAIGIELEYLIPKLMDDYYGLKFESIPSSEVRMTGAAASSHTTAVPNPTNASTTIEFTVTESSPVTMRILDAFGRTVMTRDLGARAAGRYQETLDVTDLPSGVYLATVETTAGPSVVKLTVTH